MILVVFMMIRTVTMTVFIHFLGIILHVAQILHHTLAGTVESGVVFSCVVVLIAVGFNWYVVSAVFNFAVLPSAGNLLSVTCLKTMLPLTMKRPHRRAMKKMRKKTNLTSAP